MELISPAALRGPTADLGDEGPSFAGFTGAVAGFAGAAAALGGCATGCGGVLAPRIDAKLLGAARGGSADATGAVERVITFGAIATKRRSICSTNIWSRIQPTSNIIRNAGTSMISPTNWWAKFSEREWLT